MKATISLFLLCFAALSASAASVYNFSSAPTSPDPKNLSFGFEFSTNSAITVSSLGYFDGAGLGFGTSHKVGIFNQAGDLLVSTVLDGANQALDGQFRFQSVLPIALAADQTYMLAATSLGATDAWAYGNAGSTLENFTVDSRISIASQGSFFRYQCDDVLRDPSNQFGYTIYAGPTFEIAPDFTPAAAQITPEPATLPLMGSIGGIGLLATLWKRRRSAACTSAVATR